MSDWSKRNSPILKAYVRQILSSSIYNITMTSSIYIIINRVPTVMENPEIRNYPGKSWIFVFFKEVMEN